MHKLFYVLSRQAIKNILFQDMTGPGGIKKRISSGPFAHRKKTEKMIRNPANLQDQNSVLRMKNTPQETIFQDYYVL